MRCLLMQPPALPKFCQNELVIKEHAVQFAKRFLDKFNSLIVTVLSCFDRVIFKG